MKTSGFKPFDINFIYICVMDNNLEHNDWKDDESHLSRLPKVNPFAVPDQYFESLSDRISGALFVEELKSQAGFPASDVPEGYFEHLQDDIQAKITLDALNISKAPGFTVPEGYFDQSRSSILERISQENAASGKVIKLWPSKFTKYAAAACLVLISGMAVYLNQDRLFNSSSEVSNSVAATEDPMLWDIDEQTIKDQMEVEQAGFITNTSATAEDLESYILDHYTQHDITSNL